MGRNRQFDEEQAVQQAMSVFWEYGYDATSVQMLTDAMKINRFSLYNTFGDKKALYLQALKRYRNSVLGRALSVLQSPDLQGLTKIERYVESVSRHLQSPLGELGCLIQTTGVSRAAKTEPLSGEIKSIFFGLSDALEGALNEADHRGELADDFSNQPAAQFIVTHIQGLIMMRRSGAPPDWVAAQAQFLIETIGLWRRS